MSGRTACAGLGPIVQVLASGRFDLSTEYAMQDGIAALFASELQPGDWVREHRLSAADRPDFWVFGRIVVEVKHARIRNAPILRQLARYAAHPEVEGLVLVTATSVAFPAEVGGKPLRVISTGAAWL